MKDQYCEIGATGDDRIPRSQTYRHAGIRVVMGWVVAFCAVGVVRAQTTVYVGANTCPGSGTQSDPYCTITTAILNSGDGDTIRVFPGEYEESIRYGSRKLVIESTDGPESTTIRAAGSFTTVSRHFSPRW